MDIVTILLLAIILILAGSLIWLRGRIGSSAHERFLRWREREIESIEEEQRELARREAAVQLDRWIDEHERSIRREAIERSRHVVTGKVTEQLIPYVPDFGYNPRDARFLGSPIDFIVFDGLDEGDLREIVFVEVKTGQSSLSRRERQVRDAIDAGRVRWEEMRITFHDPE